MPRVQMSDARSDPPSMSGERSEKKAQSGSGAHIRCACIIRRSPSSGAGDVALRAEAATTRSNAEAPVRHRAAPARAQLVTGGRATDVDASVTRRSPTRNP